MTKRFICLVKQQKIYMANFYMFRISYVYIYAYKLVRIKSR